MDTGSGKVALNYLERLLEGSEQPGVSSSSGEPAWELGGQDALLGPAVFSVTGQSSPGDCYASVVGLVPGGSTKEEREKNGYQVLTDLLDCGQQAKAESALGPWGLCHLLAVLPQACDLTSLCPSFLGVKWRWPTSTHLVGLA